jgi:hypothetical protein
MEEGFLTDARTAEIFFRFCARHKVENRNNRILVMRELVRRKKAKYIRDVKPLLAGKKVLRIVHKKETD